MEFLLGLFFQDVLVSVWEIMLEPKILHLTFDIEHDLVFLFSYILFDTFFAPDLHFLIPC